jgi:GntR family transcriptional regulator
MDVPAPDVVRVVEAAGPAAEEVRRGLLEQIAAGQLAAGARLGAERDLAVAFGVSRSTVRQALAALEQAGIVRRVPGRGGGTFVGHEKFERDLSHVVGVPALLQRQGMTAGSRVVSTGMVRADTATAQALDLDVDAYVIDVVRIRLADGTPLSLEHLRLPAQMFPGLLDLPLGGSVYELLEEHYAVVAGEALERIEVVPAGQQEASILGVDPDAPLLSISRTTRTPEGVAFEFSHDMFRADRTRITVRTPGRPVTASAGRARGHIVELRARDPR